MIFFSAKLSGLLVMFLDATTSTLFFYYVAMFVELEIQLGPISSSSIGLWTVYCRLLLEENQLWNQ